MADFTGMMAMHDNGARGCKLDCVTAHQTILFSRKSTKNRKIFPTDKSALKVIYLAIEAASKKWTMPIHNWKNAMNRFMIEFPDRIPETF